MDGGLRQELCEEHRLALFEVVEDLLKTDNFKVRIEPGSKKGDNFIGIVYRIIFSTADEKRSANLFLKIAPVDEMKRSTFRARQCFLREINIYDNILPFYHLFQESRHIPRSNGFHEYPQCYKSIDTEQIECLFMQDLTEKNYTMVDKHGITVEHILVVMKTIGKFHAVSLAVKDQQPEKLEEIKNCIPDPMFKHAYMLENVSIALNCAAKNVIDSITDENDAHLLKAILKLYEKTPYEIILESIDGNAAEPYSVITHGDMWSNNTMFRSDNENRPKKAYLIDWQLSGYATPVLDISYYLFLTTTRELRGRHYNTYLKMYYQSLSNHLIRLGSDPEKVFPFSALEDHLRKYAKYGLVFASFFLPVFMANAEEIDFETQKENNNNNAPECTLSDDCKKRIRDIVADMYRLGYI